MAQIPSKPIPVPELIPELIASYWTLAGGALSLLEVSRPQCRRADRLRPQAEAVERALALSAAQANCAAVDSYATFAIFSSGQGRISFDSTSMPTGPW